MLSSESTMKWEEIAKLQPSIATHVAWHAQTAGGETWYVLQNEATGEHARFNVTANAIVSRLNGRTSLQTILDEVNRLDFASCDETTLLNLMVKLQRMGALVESDFIDSVLLRDHQSKKNSVSLLKRFINPLAIRISLFDPDNVLTQFTPKLKHLFSATTLWLWVVVVVLGLVNLTMGWGEVTHEFMTRTLRVETLWWFALLFPVMKFLHEFAHAICIKHWGGQVRDIGISFLLLIPVPYVDSSDVNFSHSRTHRMILTAAGMGIELFIAMLALCCWFWIDPGYLRDALFTLFVIGGLTTLLFNANPLLKFDGYYLLQDALNIPNLAAKSSAWLKYRFQHRVLGMAAVTKPYVAERETVWLFSYGLGVLLYRPILTLTIVLFLWQTYPILGFVLACFALTQQLVLPIVKGVRWLFTSADLQGQRSRALALMFCSVCVLATALLVPMPSTTRALGVVAASDQGEVFSEAAGVVSQVHAEPGAIVKKGDKLITMINPMLHRNTSRVKSELSALGTERVVNLQRSDAKSALTHAGLQAESKRLNANLTEFERQSNALVIVAQQNGTFAPLDDNLLPGRHVLQGERIGYVVSGADWTVRTLVSEKRAAQLRSGVDHVSVRLAQASNAVIEATLLRETPAVTRQLPSAALSQHSGGSIATDPFDASHMQAMNNQFELEIQLPEKTHIAGLGQRVLVKLEHPPEPLLTRLWRATQAIWMTKAQA